MLGKPSQMCLLRLSVGPIRFLSRFFLKCSLHLSPTSPCLSQEAGVPAAQSLACISPLLSSVFLIFLFWYSLTSEAGVVGIAGDIFPSGLEAEERD